jgi:hypothetical protein
MNANTPVTPLGYLFDRSPAFYPSLHEEMRKVRVRIAPTVPGETISPAKTCPHWSGDESKVTSLFCGSQALKSLTGFTRAYHLIFLRANNKRWHLSRRKS